MPGRRIESQKEKQHERTELRDPDGRRPPGHRHPELETVARKERMTVEELLPLVASGKVVIPANRLHTCLDPEGIGSMLRTKINVNLGVSRDCKDYDVEMQKVLSAVKMGGDAIMDLSSHGNTQPFRRKLTHECPVMIGTVPVYDSVIHYQRDLDTLTAKDFIDVIRLHAEDGVDFVTLHCGITRETIDQIRHHKRKMNIVSRGGSLVFAWMCMTGQENPFYEYYDEILDICRAIRISILAGRRLPPRVPGRRHRRVPDQRAGPLGELTRRAWEKDVQVLVEGPAMSPWTRSPPICRCSRPSARARPSMYWAPWSPTSPPATTTSPRPSAGPSPP